jgi:hypothetical protein
MNEFDDLLREVLAADVCVEPPLGMERRIAAALSVQAKRRSRMRWIALDAIAAALLIGLAGMMVSRQRSAVVLPSMPSERVWRAETAASDVRSAIIPTKDFLERAAHRWPPRPVVRSRRTPRRATPGIASIAIVSLTIKPIEVASLALGKSTERSRVWGEKR